MILLCSTSGVLEASELLEELPDELGAGGSGDADGEEELGASGTSLHPPRTLVTDTAKAVVPASFRKLRRSIFLDVKILPFLFSHMIQ